MHKEKFEKKLSQHKKLIAGMVDKKDTNMIIPVQATAEELALAYAGCKCEKCKINVDLQFHHLIQRHVKDYTEFWKYLPQRNYWANILILCRKCHRDIENRILPYADNSGVISQGKIDKIKAKYEIV